MSRDSSKSFTSSSLYDVAKKSITSELGFFQSFCDKISALGIDLKNNNALNKSGFNATTFVLPEKKIVIKFFDKEPEREVATLPNLSKHMLQPFCTSEICGNRLMVFPMLEIADDEDKPYTEELCNGLAKEGYSFWDKKASNIGLTDDKTAYVIDEDAVNLKGQTQEADPSKLNQWEKISPFFIRDTPTTSGWTFCSKEVEAKMDSISPTSSLNFSSKEETQVPHL